MSDFIRVPPDASGKRINASVHNDGVNDISTQVFHLGDRFLPDQHQAVDNKGAAVVRFSDGAPDFDAFGRTTVSEPNLMGMYKFYQNGYTPYFMKTETGGATVTHDSALQGMKLTCGTASGDRASYNSHRYYHYRPGNSMSLTWTMNIGDIGKANVRRCAGWIDADNGLFFEANGTDIFTVVRNGNLATEVRTERANWNGDRLDGGGGANNLSGATIDPTKSSIWWIDFQYLGAGAIRFGTYVDGNKVTCHTEGHYNELDRPYLSSGALSFGFEQENLGPVGSSSEFHCFCAVIMNDGYDEYDLNPITFSSEKTITTTTFVPLISFRPSELKNGVYNRLRVLPQIVSALSDSGSIEIRADVNPVLTGDTWANSTSNTEYDTAATAATLLGSGRIGHFIAAGRSESIDLGSVFKQHKDGVSRNFDASTSDWITISARLLTAGSSLVAIALNSLEIE